MNSAPKISAAQPGTIRRMFAEIAASYDRTNSVLSLGIHHRWKSALVRRSGAGPGSRVLDCATGTGDLAFRFEKRVGPSGEVVGTDFCEEMLAVGRKKAQQMGSRVRLELADATALPYADATFDVASISFGIRNTSDPQKALAEMARVVKPGGRVMVLEFGQPRWAAIRAGFNLYSRWMLPHLGGWMSGKPEAYRYLERSSAAFPCGEAFLEWARATECFASLEWISFQGGIAYLYQFERADHGPAINRH